jgi:hypothetical protein
MSTEREQRKSHTFDICFIPTEVFENFGADVDAELDRRAVECDERGHRWEDPETRQLCNYCGRWWSAQPPE